MTRSRPNLSIPIVALIALVTALGCGFSRPPEVPAGDAGADAAPTDTGPDAPPPGDITSFAFRASDNTGVLQQDVLGTISDSRITINVPYQTPVTSLVASYATGGTVSVDGSPQMTGVTSNDFSAPQIYRVAAPDGSTHDYTVSVLVALNPAKDLTSFVFLASSNSHVPADISAVITDTTITATVPTPLTALVATFSTAGSRVEIAGHAQMSGVTSNDFSGPLVYRVTAEDHTTKDYTVTITAAPSNEKELTSLSFLAVDNPGLTTDVAAVIRGDRIAAALPLAVVDRSRLVPSFITTGASVQVGAVLQVSALSSNDFTGAVSYHVTAEDGSARDYVVSVVNAPSFAPSVDLVTGANPVSVAVGDLDGDGAPDLAVTNTVASTLSIWFSTTAAGAATVKFGPRFDVTTTIQPRSVAIGDIDGDGKPDLVITTDASVATVYRNTTTPGALTPTLVATDLDATSGGRFLVLSDLNGDGKLDIVVANPNLGGISVLLNSTPAGASVPTFHARTDRATGTSPSTVAIGDLNRDGHPDLAIGNSFSRTITTLINTTLPADVSPRLAASPDLIVTGGPGELAIRDLDGDGAPEIVTVTTFRLRVFQNHSAIGATSLAFTPVDYDLTTNSGCVIADDFDGDGTPDLAIAGLPSVLPNATLAGASEAMFATPLELSTVDTSGYVTAADLNRDGKLDLITTNNQASTISVFVAR